MRPYIFLTCGLRDRSKVRSAFVLLDWIGVSIYLCNSVCTTLTCLATYCGCWFTCIHFVYRKLYPFRRLRIERQQVILDDRAEGSVCVCVQHTVRVRLHADCVSSIGYLAILGTQTAVQHWTRKIPSFSSEVKG